MVVVGGNGVRQALGNRYWSIFEQNTLTLSWNTNSESTAHVISELSKF